MLKIPNLPLSSAIQNVDNNDPFVPRINDVPEEVKLKSAPVTINKEEWFLSAGAVNTLKVIPRYENIDEGLRRDRAIWAPLCETWNLLTLEDIGTPPGYYFPGPLF